MQPNKAYSGSTRLHATAQNNWDSTSTSSRDEHADMEMEETLDTPAKEVRQSLRLPATRQAITDSPMATSPTSNRGRQALPTRDKRVQDDTTAEGGTSKQARTSAETERKDPE